jgi:ankyrin repeat protein
LNQTSINEYFVDAVYAGDLAEVIKLVDAGADIEFTLSDYRALQKNVIPCAPLSIAAWSGFSEITRLLINRGAEINATDRDGNTALILACIGDQVETARILLDHGADPERHGEEGLTALMLASKNNRVELVRLLIDRGANIGSRSFDKTENTALMIAASHGMKDTLRLLLDRGADIMDEDWCGQRAIHLAIATGFAEGIRALLDHGDSPDGSMPNGQSYDDVLGDSPECMALLQVYRIRSAIGEVISITVPSRP